MEQNRKETVQIRNSICSTILICETVVASTETIISMAEIVKYSTVVFALIETKVLYHMKSSHEV